MFNWFWGDQTGHNDNDVQLSDFGFEQVYGNLRPHISRWPEKVNIKGIAGGSTSSWAATTEKNYGKDQLYDFLGVAQMLWSPHYLPIDTLAFPIESIIPEVNALLSGKVLPSDNDVKVHALDISPWFNTSLNEGVAALDGRGLTEGEVKAGNKFFTLKANGQNKAIAVSNAQEGSAKNVVKGIEVGEDASSLIFLHAIVKQGANDKAHRMIYNFDDTAELLGWYEVVYEDGFIETIPLRYGVNIMDWRWSQRIKNREKDLMKYGQHKYAYNAEAVDCSDENSEPVTFFAFEWENIRYGKKINKVNLKAVNPREGSENAIILLALSRY